MSQLLDFLPILVFVAIFFGADDIYLATAGLMVAVTIQLIAYRVMGKPIGNELKLTFWASIIFGGLTLLFRDEAFIQWKPTIVNWALAATLLGGQWIGRRNLIKSMLGSQMTLPDPVWNRLAYGWSAGFVLAGVLNLVVAFNFSMEFWVSYKLIGGFALTFAYIMITMIYLVRGGHVDLEEKVDGQEPSD